MELHSPVLSAALPVIVTNIMHSKAEVRLIARFLLPVARVSVFIGKSSARFVSLSISCCPGLLLTFNRTAGSEIDRRRERIARRSRARQSTKPAERPGDMNAKQRERLLSALQARFEENKDRHRGLEWSRVQARLEASPGKLRSLNEMEESGGEPDVVGHDKKTGEYIFYDCSAESPKGRRSLCYDRQALESRKEHKPSNNAVDAAAAMGIELLDEEEYRALQKLGIFDTKTSSWVKTPAGIRKLGGALFCDRRYDHVFLYHNGAQSYYAARGFRGSLKV